MKSGEKHYFCECRTKNIIVAIFTTKNNFGTVVLKNLPKKKHTHT